MLIVFKYIFGVYFKAMDLIVKILYYLFAILTLIKKIITKILLI